VTDALPLAGRGRRLLGTAIDMVLVPVLTLLLVMALDVVEDAEDYQNLAWVGWVFGLAIASYLMLNGYLLWRRGQTIGKALVRIAIVAGNGAKAPLWKLVCIRAPFFPLLYAVAVWPFTVLPVIDQAFIFGKRRRCLHDLAAGTQVVDVRGQ
jgi:uncharacterized RDD family membrane protein YckC